MIVPSAEQIRQRLHNAVHGVIRYRQHLTGCEINQTDFCSCGLRESMDDLHETWKSSFALLDTLSQDVGRLTKENAELLTRSGKPDVGRDFSIHAATSGEGLEHQWTAENLYEAIGGDLCICQRPEVSHWCEGCQRRLQIIREALNHSI